jgi:ferric-dicitrate binding protein FerR (iron transport regulator)
VSCRREEEILRLGARGGSDGDLSAHAAGCPDCREAMQILDAAARRLREAPADPSGDALLRIRRALVSATATRPEPRAERAWRWAWALVPAGATLALVLALGRDGSAPMPAQPELVLGRVTEIAPAAPSQGEIVARPDGAPLPEQVPLWVEAKARIRVGPARIVTGEASALKFPPAVEGRALELESGYLALAVEDGGEQSVFVVETPAARIAVIATVFRVRADARGTQVEVEQGRAEVIPRFGAPSRVVVAGERVFVPLAPPPAAEQPPLAARSASQLATRDARPAPPARALRATASPEQAPAAKKPPPPAGSAPVQPAVAAAPEVPDPEPASPETSAPARAIIDPPAATPAIPSLPPPQAERPGEPKQETPEQRRAEVADRLAEARRAVNQGDAPKAKSLAEDALEQRPEPAQEAEALMIVADASRRSGAADEAIAHYLKVAAHAAGGPYAEEALLRAARLLGQTKDHQRALDLLEDARLRFASGPLLPERIALEAQQWRSIGRPEQAAARLEAVASVSLALAKERLETARAMLRSDPRRAELLVAPLAKAGVAKELRRSALQIQIDARRRQGDPAAADALERELR